MKEEIKDRAVVAKTDYRDSIGRNDTPKKASTLTHLGYQQLTLTGEERKRVRVLDFGCGAGGAVYAFRDAGYDAYGFDIRDYLSLRDEDDRKFFKIGFTGPNILPFDDNTFDLVISEQVFEHVKEQVAMLKELRRIMKPGSISLHVFPARYAPVEPHIYVPFGGVFAHRWWYLLWATLGIRNEYQKGLPAGEVAHRNAFYFVEALNYVPNSCYEATLKELSFEYRWFNQENFDSSHRSLVRFVGRVNRFFPLLGWLNRTFFTRRLALIKPIDPGNE